MKERPILFNSEMVRAILDGRKTQTRRPYEGLYSISRFDGRSCFLGKSPFGEVGDRLWVRETWATQHKYDHLPPRLVPKDANFHYLATTRLGGIRTRRSIHMPRWASRILLEVVDVRIERLSDTSEENAKAEGFETAEDFLLAFDEIYTNRKFPQGSYAWVCEFKVLKGLK